MDSPMTRPSRYISVLENRDLIPFVYRIENNKLQVFHKPLVNDIQRDFKYKRENTPYKDFIPTDNYTAELTDSPPLFMLVIDRSTNSKQQQPK